jgi:hypothetical protein
MRHGSRSVRSAPRAHRVLLGVFVVLVMGVESAPSVAAADDPILWSPAFTCNGAWEIIPSPNVAAQDNVLLGTSALSATSAWAVGYSSTTRSSTLIERWNGSMWSVVPSPNVGNHSRLQAVWARARKDAWAVGYTVGLADHTLIEHWDGSAWSVVPSPNVVGSNVNQLLAVEGTSASDVWTVGYYHDSVQATNLPLFEHWDGITWNVVPGPAVDSGAMQGVVAMRPSNVAAAGSDEQSFRTEVNHWNGSAWTVSRSPNAPNSEDFLYGVTADPSGSEWAVGQADGSGGIITLTLEHTTGPWTLVSSPNPGADSYLRSVTAPASDDAWAVGGWYDQSFPPTHTLVEHWDGTAWSVVTSPDAGPTNTLGGASSTGPNDVWAVGSSSSDSLTTQTLVEHYCSP